MAKLWAVSKPRTLVACVAIFFTTIGIGALSAAEPPAPQTGKPVPIKRMTVAQAYAKNLLLFEVRGSGLESIQVTLKSTSKKPIEVVIARGTIFQSTNKSVQNMVATEEKTVRLMKKDDTEKLSIDVSCGNMDRSTPGKDDVFTISFASASGDLARLLSNPNFAKASFRIRQFAIWTITDNPRRNGYVGIGAFGLGNGPDQNELQQIAALFVASRIDPRSYRAFAF
jgi:hypothetical protein